MSNPIRSKKKISQSANNEPDPQAVAEIRARYFSWLVKREEKRLQGRRAHWLGKKIPSTQA